MLQHKTVNISFEIEGICPIKMDKWVTTQQPKKEQRYILPKTQIEIFYT